MLGPVVVSAVPRKVLGVALAAWQVARQSMIALLEPILLEPIPLVLIPLKPTLLALVLALLAGCCLAGQSPAMAESVPVMAVVEIP